LWIVKRIYEESLIIEAKTLWWSRWENL